MDSNEILLIILLVITLLSLIFHYVIDICNFSLKTPFNEKFATKQVEVGGKDLNCMSMKGFDMFPIQGYSTLTTLDAIKDKQTRNYHTDYTCDARVGKGPNLKNNIYFAKPGAYTSDIASNSLLLAYNCISLRPKTLKAKLLSLRLKGAQIFNEENFTIIESSECNLDSPAALESIIKSKLKTSSDGPVYACVSQAPFWEGMNARFTVDQHMSSCYIKNSNKYGSCDNLVSKCEILLIYLNSNKTLIDEFVKFVTNNKSYHDLCHIKCNKNTLSCGCMSLENAYSFDNGADVYSSKCYAPDDKNVPGIAPLKDYSMIYFLNPYNTNVKINPWTITITE